MQYDDSKIDDIVLAVLYLAAFDEHGVTRAWKGIDWAATDRLQTKGFIVDANRRAKSIVFTGAGLARAKVTAEKLFSRDRTP